RRLFGRLDRRDRFGHGGQAAAPALGRRLVRRAVALIGPALRADRVGLLHVIELRRTFETDVLGAEILGGHQASSKRARLVSWCPLPSQRKGWICATIRADFKAAFVNVTCDKCQ